MGDFGEHYRRSKLLVMPNILITYKEQSFIDYFDEKGNLLHRVDLSTLFAAYEGLSLITLEKVKSPKLAWSCRSSNLLPQNLVFNNMI